jgi:hypothetical protein
MRNFGNFHSGWARSLIAVAGMVVLPLVLASCGALGGGGGGNPLPTPLPAEQIGSSTKSQAKDSYQATWDSYLRDSIAAGNQIEDVKISMYQRYEKPSNTAQNLGGLLKQTDLLQDRTKFNVSANNTASALADFDVKITFANGDTDTRHCKPQVAIELNPDDKLWYVLNPAPLAVLSICSS